jgi:hypothetical protein
MTFFKEDNHFHMNMIVFLGTNDGTLSNFLKRKHPRKGEKKKQGAWTKVQASK